MERVDPKANRHVRSRYNMMSPVYNLLEIIPERFMFRKWRRELWAKVDGKKVLEIGVGTGKNIAYHPAGISVQAVDLSEGMLARARQEADKFPDKHVDLHLMDAQNMQFKDEHFDNVMGTFVYCSVNDPVQGLKEAYRVTRPGGRLFLIEHMLSDSPLIGWLMKKLDGIVHWMMGLHIARQTVENVREAGWEIEQVENLSAFNIFRMIVARKSN